VKKEIVIGARTLEALIARTEAIELGRPAKDRRGDRRVVRGTRHEKP